MAAFAPEPFGLALGVSTDTAKTLLADALDLVHRLPHTWRRLQTLEVPVWRGRRLAQKTHALNVKAAAHVDRLLAPRLHTVGVTRLDRAIAQAVAKYMPEEHAKRRGTLPADLGRHPAPPEPHRVRRHQRAPHHRRHPHPHHPLRPDLRRPAADLKTAGDHDPLGVRKATALRTLTGTPKTKLYLHLDPADVVVSTGSTTEHRVGRVENLGPATPAKIHAWLGHSRATIQPPLRMDRNRPRSTPTTRRPGCATWSSSATPPASSPTANATAEPATSTTSTPTTTHGPPGQTSPANLAPLCRRHHRAKTTGRWTYRRLPNGGYWWTGPGFIA